MRSLLVFLLSVFVPVAAAADSFRPVYEHGSGELIPDLEYGSTDESDAAFVMSTWIDFDVAANGDVYLLECTLCLVKQFDADGELISEFGDEGERPGYLRTPSQIAVGPDGRVWIYELGNRRFSVFTAGGEFIETYHFTDVVWDMDVSSQGTLYSRVQLADRKGEWGGSRHRLVRFSGDMTRQVWLVFEPDGQFLGRVSLVFDGVQFSGGYVYRVNIGDEYNSVERMRLVIPGRETGRP